VSVDRDDGTTVRPAPLVGPETGKPHVLVVEDDALLARALSRVLANAGFEVEVALDGVAATNVLLGARFDVVVSDINLPGTNGVDLLRTIRAYDLDLPVILCTGSPTVETAIEAVELGALQYLVKPVEKERLVAAVQRASDLHHMARLKREALRLSGDAADRPGDRAGLSSRLDTAIDTLFVVFQPIVDLKKNVLFGYEALMRSREPSLPSPLDILRAAERLGRVYDVGRMVRRRVVASIEQSDDKTSTFFINLHTSELLDATLYEGSSRLTGIAERIVLEVTEREAIDKVEDVKARASVLRFHGFRLAIDDLGTGYAGLTSFVTLEPDIVKLDMSLIRGIDSSPIKQQLVRSVVDLCHQLKMRVVAEGIETQPELRTTRLLGCDFGQGFFIGSPDERLSGASAVFG